MLRLPLTLALLGTVAQGKPPHLVLFLIDDLGYDDVGYHGSDFPTPNIDNLATQGVRLERFYAQQVCSPSRSAFMSGRYPFRTGMQHRFTLAPQSTGHLPLNATTLAEALGNVGYRCHTIGKWHLGYASWNYTPLGRGFESHAGYFQAQSDYYQHTDAFFGLPDPFGLRGFDFWRNKTVAKDQIGKYSVDFYMEEAERVLNNHNPDEPLFLYFAQQIAHLPLQGPPEEIYRSNCAKISLALPDGFLRSVMCSMISRLDKQIGDLVDMLKRKGLWEDTVMWVTSDNGGMTHWGPMLKESSVASNYPLRGGKMTLFEGGMRVVNFVTGGMSAIAAAAGSVRWELVQHVDIPTTLAAIAGANLGEGIDGFDVWNVVVEGHQSPRTEVPLNIDQDSTNFSALIQGKWKLINTEDEFASHCDGWWSSEPYKRTFPNSSQVSIKIDGWKVMLFDIIADPQERKNVALSNVEIVRKMLQRINELADPSNGYRPAQPNEPDPSGDPKLHDGCLAPWLDNKDTAVTPVTLFM